MSGLAGSSHDYDDDEELPPLTSYLVDKALDEVRPYLIADGGNVEVAAVQDGVVMLRLQGACGTCPSSTATMKMGIERSLRVGAPHRPHSPKFLRGLSSDHIFPLCAAAEVDQGLQACILEKDMLQKLLYCTCCCMSHHGADPSK